jgi:(2R)-3-sulfolactate dehydrogenase (NADP+)
VPIYAAQARAGKVDGQATPSVLQTRPGSLMIDVANGFVFPAVDLAVERLPGLAAATALPPRASCARIISASSAGTSSGWRTQALLCLAFANTPRRLRLGRRQPVLGTNPLAFAAPRGTSRHRCRPGAEPGCPRQDPHGLPEGRADPGGWAVDEHGNPTRTPSSRSRAPCSRSAAPRARRWR